MAVYTTGAITIPARVRATGMGIVMRWPAAWGSIFGPYTAGVLLGMQFNRFTVCAILAIPVLLSIGAPRQGASERRRDELPRSSAARLRS